MSFSERTDAYIAIDSLPEWEEVRSGSSNAATLNCLQGLTFRKVNQLAKLCINLFDVSSWELKIFFVSSQFSQRSMEYKLHEGMYLGLLFSITSLLRESFLAA